MHIGIEHAVHAAKIPNFLEKNSIFQTADPTRPDPTAEFRNIRDPTRPDPTRPGPTRGSTRPATNSAVTDVGYPEESRRSSTIAAGEKEPITASPLTEST